MSVLLAVQEVAGSGAVPIFVAAAAAGNHFSNDGRVTLEFVNGHTAPITVTIDSFTPCNQGFDHDLIFSIAAGTRWRTPTLDPGRFRRADGNTYITYSLVTALTVSAIRS
ncbi:MAG: hypothetical protein DDT37_02009 [Firmicutes bacterium]|nr:hypothetical protein [candidate division NPL-UPA2 bacterium]